MEKKYAIGADIGGSHISAAVVDMSNGELFESTRISNPLDNKAAADEIIEKWGSTIDNVIGKIGLDNVKGIGLAMPGPFDYVNGISLFDGATKKYENTYGLNVSNALKHYLQLPESYPVRFINDAAAFAIGEAWNGKAKHTSRSLSITIGTGLGSGFISDGVPLFNSENIPEDGFIYHLPYKDGIADDYFSTRGWIKAYAEMKGHKVSGAKEIAIIAETDKETREMIMDFGKQLAQFLIPWLRKFEAEAIVLGGNISKSFDLFGEPMINEIKASGLNIRVEESQLNDKAQILGAAKLVDDTYWQNVLPNLQRN